MVALALSQTGCIVFYSYYPARVTVRDAETGAPIFGAQVGVYYVYMFVLNAPHPDSASTNERGEAHVQAATFTPQWNAGGQKATHPKVAPYAGCDLWKKSGQNWEVWLYREPQPRITIIVPPGYRGPLKVERIPLAAFVQDAPGKREFTFHATAKGYVGINASPLLMRREVYPPSAEYEGGQPIPENDWHVTPTDIALRPVESQGLERDLYIIGTEDDVKAIRPQIYFYRNGDPHDAILNEAGFEALFHERCVRHGSLSSFLKSIPQLVFLTGFSIRREPSKSQLKNLRKSA